jgi:hypothetical protein
MKQQYDKVILAASAIVGLGLAYLGYSKSSNAEADFEFIAKSNGQANVAVQSAPLLNSTLALVEKPHILQQAVCSDSQRPIDQFVGVSLFAKKAESGSKIAKPVDPVLDAPIHPPIPNSWWLENQIDPGFANSPQRDEDGDGFTNLEEFEAKTDADDKKAHPSLLQKLRFVKYESVGYFLWFSSSLGPNQYQFKIVQLPPVFESASLGQQQSYLANSLQYNRTKSFISVTSNIFDEGFGKNRFRLKEVVEREVTNEATKLTMKNEFAVIEDLAPHKQDTFEIPKTPRAKERPATVRYDRSAVLVLDAVGEEGKEFKVLENTQFSLPNKAGQKAYLLKKITPEALTVEFKDKEGKTQTVEIPKS